VRDGRGGEADSFPGPAQVPDHHPTSKKRTEGVRCAERGALRGTSMNAAVGIAPLAPRGGGFLRSTRRVSAAIVGYPREGSCSKKTKKETWPIDIHRPPDGPTGQGERSIGDSAAGGGRRLGGESASPGLALAKKR